MEIKDGVIIRLEGGLGNQMFQYALGRYLAHRNNLPLRFDISSFETNPIADCSFWLEGFHINIGGNLATEAEIAYFKRFKPKLGRRYFLHNLFADPTKYIQEQHFHFDPKIPAVTGKHLYLDGWWQSEKYFSPIRKFLLDDFTTRSTLSAENAAAAARMRTSDAIGMHIRRSDYVKNPITRRWHGELSKKYFDEALAHILPHTSHPILFVFSDDIVWVKDNFSFPLETVYVTWNGWESGDVGHEDVRLMSLCKHNIISNSTLSWWGAWLNQHEKKIVVAPAQWFADAPKNNAKDIVPADWVKIPSHFKA